MSISYYRRDGSQTSDAIEAWAGDRKVGEDVYKGFLVSTVHLPINHQFGEGPPLIFETMVFSSEAGEVASWMDLYCDRYSTEKEAVAGHARVVAALKDGSLEMYGLDEDES